MEKERPKRVFRRGKKPLGKTSGKIREKKAVEVINEIEKKKVEESTSWLQQYLFNIQKHINKKFPNIKRYIPEWKVRESFRPWVQGGWVAIVVFGAVFSLWEFAKLGRVYPQYSQLISERSALEADLHTWENISTEYPTYRDAHFQAAVIAYRLGKHDIMEDELKKVFEIDPNFEPAKLLQEKE